MKSFARQGAIAGIRTFAQLTAHKLLKMVLLRDHP